MPRLLAALLLGASAIAAAATPQRIVTLAPNLAELVCAAGGCARLVAVSAWSDYPASVKALPQIGDGFSFNYESLLAMRPDLVLAWSGGTPDEVVARLRALHLRVEPVKVEGLDGVADALQRIGGWLGTAAVADAAAQAYRERLAALRARWKNASPVRVAYQIGSSPAYTVNGHSPISAAMALCGGVNVFAGMDTLSGPVGAEAMLAAQPQAVFYGGEENRAAIEAYWARLPGSTVEQRGTLYPVDADWLARATPRLLDGVQQVCEGLDRARAKLAAVHAR